MTSLLFIGNPPQTRGGIIQVTGGSSADPPQSAAGLKNFRGGIISGQVSGIAGGSEKSSAGVGGLVKIPLDCTVLSYRGRWFALQSVFSACLITLTATGAHDCGKITPVHARHT